MKNIRIIGLVLIMMLLSTIHAYGGAPSWSLDKGHSNIYFSVVHIFSSTNGFFGDFDTDIRFDPKDLASSSFMFEIKVGSINTAIAKRDKHLQSEDFFDASEYPVMTYKSSKVVDRGNSQYDVMGKLTVKGEEYDLTLPLMLAGIKDHPAQKGVEVAGFNGKLILNRLDYGIGDGRFSEMGVVGKDVDVFVSIEVLKNK